MKNPGMLKVADRNYLIHRTNDKTVLRGSNQRDLNESASMNGGKYYAPIDVTKSYVPSKGSASSYASKLAKAIDAGSRFDDRKFSSSSSTKDNGMGSRSTSQNGTRNALSKIGSTIERNESRDKYGPSYNKPPSREASTGARTIKTFSKSSSISQARVITKLRANYSKENDITESYRDETRQGVKPIYKGREDIRGLENKKEESSFSRVPNRALEEKKTLTSNAAPHSVNSYALNGRLVPENTLKTGEDLSSSRKDTGTYTRNPSMLPHIDDPDNKKDTEIQTMSSSSFTERRLRSLKVSEDTSYKGQTNKTEVRPPSGSSTTNSDEKKQGRISSHVTILASPHSSSVPKGLIGLRNIGNTCFMNSILQCLFNAPLFSDHFLKGNHIKEKNSKSKGVAAAFGSLLERMKSHTGSPSSSAESTHEVKSRVSKVNSMFSGYDQHDAQEFLKTLLEAINDDLNRVVTKPAYKELTINSNKKLQETSNEWFDYMLNRDNSVVTDLFCGQLLSKTRCTSCNYESLAFDNYWDLALSFIKGSSSRTHVKDMIEQFLKEEELDDLFYCEKCKTRRKSKKKFVIWRLPKILVLQLKRFEYTQWRREKINKSVTFPVKSLDLGQFTEESTDCSVRDSKYTLFGIVNHGGSLSGGHYTADCMNIENRKWYTFNDSAVGETYMKGEEGESSSPYILFYVKSSCIA